MENLVELLSPQDESDKGIQFLPTYFWCVRKVSVVYCPELSVRAKLKGSN